MSTYLIYPNDEQEKMIKEFLESNDISFVREDEQLPDYVLQGIARGQEDIKAGRTITFEEFKNRVHPSK